MTAVSMQAPAKERTVNAGRWLMYGAIGFLCLWVLVPIYLIMVNALSSPDEVNGWPKQFYPTFDLGSLSFFIRFQGVAWALFNSLVVALLTTVLAIGLGAPAGYALARFRFRGKECFRLLVLMTRAFPLPLLACRWRCCSSAPASTIPKSAWRWSTPRWRCPSPSSSLSRSS